ncbi:MAG TPA: ABC transporter ATP-binding protein [Pseudolabrys sp.]|nr:ABC transporter ATP-binding protein [Pseudolabrys sp.]
MLQVQNVSKVYGGFDREYTALEKIDLSIREGEFLCLLGPSGCGKSTLLNILAGFERPSSGRVLLNGVEISGPGHDRVMFFQDAGSALFPWLDCEENVEFGLRLKGVAKAQRREVAARYLETVGLSQHRNKFPSELSGGMRQRLQIARALAIEPAMFLMDEPFAALDALTRRNMHRVLVEIWMATRKTIIFVTHDISEAITMADRIVIMTQGPRSRLRDPIVIELSRPRTPAQAGLGALYNRIESIIGEEQDRAGEAAS